MMNEQRSIILLIFLAWLQTNEGLVSSPLAFSMTVESKGAIYQGATDVFLQVTAQAEFVFHDLEFKVLLPYSISISDVNTTGSSLEPSSYKVSNHSLTIKFNQFDSSELISMTMPLVIEPQGVQSQNDVSRVSIVVEVSYFKDKESCVSDSSRQNERTTVEKVKVLQIYHPDCDGFSALGFFNGDIKESQLTASSYFVNESIERPHSHARLSSGSWWQPASGLPYSDVNQFIEIELNKLTSICVIAIEKTSSYIQSYSIQFSENGFSWTEYLFGGKLKSFKSDDTTIALTVLTPPIFGRFLRIIPKMWVKSYKLRMEVYGCSVGSTFSDALGMESGSIDSSQISSSEALYKAWFGRLNNQGGGGGWCALYNNDNQHFQIDLQGTFTITKLSIQGKFCHSICSDRVTSFLLQYGFGQSFTTYQMNGQDKVFLGNLLSHTTIKHTLHSPLTTRYLRFLPRTYIGNICMRVEAHGKEGTTTEPPPVYKRSFLLNPNNNHLHVCDNLYNIQGNFKPICRVFGIGSTYPWQKVLDPRVQSLLSLDTNTNGVYAGTLNGLVITNSPVDGIKSTDTWYGIINEEWNRVKDKDTMVYATEIPFVPETGPINNIGDPIEVLTLISADGFQWAASARGIHYRKSSAVEWKFMILWNKYDFQQCALGQHDCHILATCVQLPNGYKCQCQEGSMGDGRKECFPKRSIGLDGSEIAGNIPELGYLNKWVYDVQKSRNKWTRCYHAKTDGWRSSTFHDQCAEMGPTVVIIQVGEYVFGGYADQGWMKGSGVYSQSNVPFLFSLRNKANTAPMRFGVYTYSDKSLYHHYSYGPTFGRGHDLYIFDNAGSSTSSYTNIGGCYTPPPGTTYGSAEARSFLAGTYTFTPTNMEVFYQPQDSYGLESSSILSRDSTFLPTLSAMLAHTRERGSTWTRCFQASVDGDKSSVYHAQCDNKGPTVTIVRVGNYVFGGYFDRTLISQSVNYYKRDYRAFLFSLKNYYNRKALRLYITSSPHAFYYRPFYGPTFGQGHDLMISSDATSNTGSYTNLGHSYHPPYGLSYGNDNTQRFLAGTYAFTVTDYEVFYLSGTTPVEGFLSSKVLGKNAEYINHLNNWLAPVLASQATWIRCFDGKTDGWNVFAFHDNCDAKGPTVTLIRRDQYVFGAYSDVSWSGTASSPYYPSMKAFLFTLRNKDNLPPMKLPLYRNRQFATRHYQLYGPTFGETTGDIHAPNLMDNNNVYTNLGRSYSMPEGYVYGSTATRSFLAGDYPFSPSEFEVFYQQQESGGLENSAIIGNNPLYYNQMSNMLAQVRGNDDTWVRCYFSTNDGWSAATFHNLCDSKGPTVTLVKVGNYIGGGYADLSWKSQYLVKRSYRSFLFSLKNSVGRSSFVLYVKSISQALNHHYDRGPTFGQSYGLFIADNAGNNVLSRSNPGYTYSALRKYVAGSTEFRSLMFGSHYFTPDVMEVFYLKTGETDISINDSLILADKPEYLSLLKNWLKPDVWSPDEMVRCYHSLNHSFSALHFHERCDMKGPTVSIVRKGQYIFGGFTDRSFNSFINAYVRGTTSFIFSLKNKDNIEPLKLLCKISLNCHHMSSTSGPTYGAGYDIKIADEADSSTGSRTNLGHSYNLPNGYSYGSAPARSFLAGEYTFRVGDIEVFYIKKHPSGLETSVILIENMAQDLVGMVSGHMHSDSKWTLCYRASRDTWAAATFHDKCDSKGATITIVKKQDFVFGGFTDVSWGMDGKNGYLKSYHSFLFGLVVSGRNSPSQMEAFQNVQKSMRSERNYLPTFGGGHDLYLADNAGGNTNSFTAIGYTYLVPYGSNGNAYFTGSKYFKPDDLEVFYLSRSTQVKGFDKSKIIGDNLIYPRELESMLAPRRNADNWTRCYHAQQDGWTAFHELCDQKGPTVIIIRTRDETTAKDSIFGGYADRFWDVYQQQFYVASTQSFLFTLKNSDSLPPQKFKTIDYFYNALYMRSGFGPRFYDDLIIQYSGRDESGSSCNLGRTFETPSGYVYNNANTKNFLAGISSFYPLDMEVFYQPQKPVGLSSSSIVGSNPEYLQLMADILAHVQPTQSDWVHCWKPSVDGWSSSVFHDGCDLKGPTVTIVRVGEYVFGGYSDISWDTSGYSESRSSFLFSLKNNGVLKKSDTMIIHRYETKALRRSPDYGPSFSQDLVISDNANITSCSSNLGYTYSSPMQNSYGSTEVKSFLAGSQTFNPVEIEVFYQPWNMTVLEDSYILSDNQSQISLIRSWVDPVAGSNVTWSTCFDSRRDGHSAYVFHGNCDNKGSLIVLAKSGKNIFGGFHPTDWKNSGGYETSTDTFLFSLVNNDDLPPFKMDYKGSYTAYMRSNYCPTFGNGHDLHINNEFYGTKENYANIGYSFKIPEGYTYGTAKARRLLAGSQQFGIDFMEVFQKVNN